MTPYMVHIMAIECVLYNAGYDWFNFFARPAPSCISAIRVRQMKGLILQPTIEREDVCVCV